MTFNEDDLIACICEGESEKTIVKILLEENSLVFLKEQLIVLDSHKYRKAKKFQDDFLKVDYGNQKLYIVYIGDKMISYAFDSPFEEKVEKIYYHITKPELESLMIHSLDLWREFNKVKSNTKPCIFLAQHLKKKISDIKSGGYIKEFYEDHSLIEAMKIYKTKSNHKKEELHLYDLIKPDKRVNN